MKNASKPEDYHARLALQAFPNILVMKEMKSEAISWDIYEDNWRGSPCATLATDHPHARSDMLP